MVYPSLKKELVAMSEYKPQTPYSFTEIRRILLRAASPDVLNP